MADRWPSLYQDSRGGLYFKVGMGTDPLTGWREPITGQGLATASATGRARREVLGLQDSGLVGPAPKLLTVNELLELTSTASTPTGRSEPRPGSTTGRTSAPTSRLWLGAGGPVRSGPG
jgi:hypothetical protein